MFPIAAAPFYIPTNRVPEFQFLHMLTSPYFLFVLIIAILTATRLYLIVILACISQMISDIDCLSIYLLAICMSSLEKYLFNTFAHFKIRLFVFCLFVLLMSCRSSLFILDINFLSVVCKYFLPLHRLHFSLYYFLCHTEPFYFDVVSLVYFCICS